MDGPLRAPAPNLDLRGLLRAVSSNVRRAMRCDYASVILPEPDDERLRIYARDLSELPEPMRRPVAARLRHAGRDGAGDGLLKEHYENSHPK